MCSSPVANVRLCTVGGVTSIDMLPDDVLPIVDLCMYMKIYQQRDMHGNR